MITQTCQWEEEGIHRHLGYSSRLWEKSKCSTINTDVCSPTEVFPFSGRALLNECNWNPTQTFIGKWKYSGSLNPQEAQNHWEGKGCQQVLQEQEPETTTHDGLSISPHCIATQVPFSLSPGSQAIPMNQGAWLRMAFKPLPPESQRQMCSVLWTPV